MTRSGRLLRLRRTAHRPPRRGPCRSPCPRLRLAGSTPFGDVVPHCLRQRLPLLASNGEGFSKRALAQAPQGQGGAGEDGDLLANRHRNPQPPRGRNACYGVLREGLRGRKRFVPGTAKPWQAGTPFLILARSWPPGPVLWYGRVNRFSGDLGYGNITHTRCGRCRANLGPFW
jgi:hypothetical protein